MVQFLSIIFLLDFFNFCWVFQKFPFFCVSLYMHALLHVFVNCVKFVVTYTPSDNYHSTQTL